MKVAPLMVVANPEQAEVIKEEEAQVSSKEWFYIALITAVSIAYYW